MKDIELILILDKTNWLEATWIENSIQIHCESYSGHKEHIEMLKNKALEFGTSLDVYNELIKQCQDTFVYPTDEEISIEELQNKIQEAKSYLSSTDFKMTVDYFAELTKVVQDELIVKRSQAREFIRLNEGVING